MTTANKYVFFLRIVWSWYLVLGCAGSDLFSNALCCVLVVLSIVLHLAGLTQEDYDSLLLHSLLGLYRGLYIGYHDPLFSI